MHYLPVWSLIIHNKHTLKFHTFGENQGGVSFQRSLCTRNIIETALHSLPTPPASPVPSNIPTTSLSHCKKPAQQLATATLLQAFWMKRHRQYIRRGMATQPGAQGRSGPKAIRHKQGEGGFSCTSCSGGSGLGPSGPHPRFADSLSRSFAADTTNGNYRDESSLLWMFS